MPFGFEDKATLEAKLGEVTEAAGGVELAAAPISVGGGKIRPDRPGRPDRMDRHMR